MNAFFYRLAKVFGRNKKISKYKEIFSTTENKLNLQNTSPLEIPDEQLDSDAVNVKSFFQDEFFDKTRTSEFLSEEVADLYPEYTETQDVQTAEKIKTKLKKEIKSLNIKFFAITIFPDFRRANPHKACIFIGNSSKYLGFIFNKFAFHFAVEFCCRIQNHKICVYSHCVRCFRAGHRDYFSPNHNFFQLCCFSCFFLLRRFISSK